MNDAENYVHHLIQDRYDAFKKCGLTPAIALDAAKTTVYPIELFRQMGDLQAVARCLQAFAGDIEWAMCQLIKKDPSAYWLDQAKLHDTMQRIARLEI